jgi:signal transduction histidine kinase
MDRVNRVVIKDKHPAFDPDIFLRRINRVVLLVAGVSILVQVAGLVQVLLGQGTPVGWFDHMAFAVVGFLWLVVGVLVFLQRRAGRAGQYFLLSAAAGSIFLSLGTLYYHTNLFDSALYAIGVLLFPPFLYGFTRAFLAERAPRRWEVLIFLPSVLLVWAGANDVYVGQASVRWRFAIALVGVFLVASILQTVYDLRSARTAEQAAQVRALLFGLIAGVVPGLVIIIGPLVVQGNFAASTSAMPPLVFLFLLAMSYAVLLYEFSEADLIVRRGVVYGALTLVIVLADGALGVILLAGRSSVTSLGGGFAFVAVTVLVGAMFTPVVRWARRLVDWLLYGGHTDRWELLQALSARLATVMQPEELGDRLVRELTEALHLRGAFLLRRSGEDRFVLWCQADGRERAPTNLELDAATLHTALGQQPAPLLLVHGKPLTASRRAAVPEKYRQLDDLRSAFTIPLVTRSGLEAVLCLKPKLAHDAFDADDIELLAPVIRQASAALDNALLFARLDEKVEELRHAYVRIAREQEAERARLARELHDGTAQELAGLITLAAVVERQLDNGGSARVTLDRLRQQAQDAYQGVRRASHALRPLMLDDFGLVPTLSRHLKGFQEATGIRVEYTPAEVGELPDDVELALFRVAQECMENVRKHSGAEQANVTLTRASGEIILTVVDSGRGISLRGERGIGLTGIRERIETVGGAIKVDSAPGQGVHIEARIPVKELGWKAPAFASS